MPRFRLHYNNRRIKKLTSAKRKRDRTTDKGLAQVTLVSLKHGPKLQLELSAAHFAQSHSAGGNNLFLRLRLNLEGTRPSIPFRITAAPNFSTLSSYLHRYLSSAYSAALGDTTLFSVQSPETQEPLSLRPSVNPAVHQQ